jgi:hypothetical protein
MHRLGRRALRIMAAGAVAAAVLAPAAAVGQEYPTPNSVPTVSADPGGSNPGASRPDAGARSRGTETSGTGSDSGTLPVTGGDAAGLALIGLGITGAGLVLVRLARRPAQGSNLTV